MKTPFRKGEAAIAAAFDGGDTTIHFPPFRLDANNERLWRGKQLVALRPKTFAVLHYLLERPGQLVRKEELLDSLWGDVSVGEAVLKTYLREIRRALGDSARRPLFIETAHRRGYRFIGRVLSATERASDEPPDSGARPALVREPETSQAMRCSSPSDLLVGRAAELERLAESARTALAGERSMLFVSGEPGIGKTTLLQAFLQRSDVEGRFALAWGQCVDQGGAGEAYLPLLEAIRRLSRGPERRWLATVLRREAPSWLSHMPGVVDHADSSAARSGFGATPERMLFELAEALESFTRERPLLLWLEDLHWADPSTLAGISYLARRSDPARLLLVGSYRSLPSRREHPLADFRAELSLKTCCEELELGFLSRAELELYFQRRFPGHRFPPQLPAAVHAQTGGNPLFLARVVDSWLKRELVSCAKGTWQLTVELEHVLANAPANVVGMIERELGALSPLERGVLEAASVAGMEFCTASLAAALEEDLVPVEEACLRWARRRQFVRVQGESDWPDGTTAMRCEFIHALYRQVAYEGIGPARRARLHARIGAREENAYGTRASEIAASLAVHFARGQKPEKAITYLAAAGVQALRRSACREAIAHFQQALELAARLEDSPERRRIELELLVALGTPLAMTLGHAASEVEKIYSRARSLCVEQEPTLPLFQALMGVGAFYLVRADYETADTLSRRFLLLAHEQQDPGLVLPAFLLHGMARLFLGDLDGAEGALDRTVLLYDSERHRAHVFLFMQDPCVCALALSIFPLFIQGRVEEARERAERALTLARELTHPPAVVLARLALAQVAQWSGESERALEHAEAGLSLAVEHGFELYEQTLRMQLGSTLIQQGKLLAGLLSLEAGLERLSESGSDFAGTHWRSLFALALLRNGRGAAAARVLADAFSRVERCRELFWEPELHRVLGELLLEHTEPFALGELEAKLGCETLDAEACFETALKLARKNHARWFELRAATCLARLWAARGEVSRARAELGAACGGFGESVRLADLEEARRLLASFEAGSA